MTPSLPDQAVFVALIAVVLLIVIGRTLQWLGRMLLLLLVATTIFVWVEPGLVGGWMVRGRHWMRETAHALHPVGGFRLDR